jgi:uncharacterized membrane protein
MKKPVYEDSLTLLRIISILVFLTGAICLIVGIILFKLELFLATIIIGFIGLIFGRIAGL